MIFGSRTRLRTAADRIEMDDILSGMRSDVERNTVRHIASSLRGDYVGSSALFIVPLLHTDGHESIGSAIEIATQDLLRIHGEAPKPDGILFGMIALQMAIRGENSTRGFDSAIGRAARAILGLTTADLGRDAGLHALGLFFMAYSSA